MTVETAGLDRLRKDMRYLATHVLRVGMVSRPHLTSQGEGNASDKQRDDEGQQTPKTVGEVLFFHENGIPPMPNSPARAPIKVTMATKSALIEKDVKDFTSKMIEGVIDAERTLAFVGEKIVIHIKQTLKSGLPPELSEARKKEKRRIGKPADTPLIFRGQLSGSFRYAIVKDTGA